MPKVDCSLPNSQGSPTLARIFVLSRALTAALFCSLSHPLIAPSLSDRWDLDSYSDIVLLWPRVNVDVENLHTKERTSERKWDQRAKQLPLRSFASRFLYQNPNRRHFLLLPLMELRLATFLFHLLSLPLLVLSKSTIEPCSVSDSCNALVGYTLYTELKVSEVAALFQVDPIAILNANAIDISIPDVENHILPAGLFLKIPTICSCADGIRKSVSTRYKTRPSDTLSSIADSVYAGLVSADQIREANSITDPSVVDVGQIFVIPLPCTCFNSSDNFLPAIYLSYVVLVEDTVPSIAARYSTTVTDIMNVNAMGSPVVRAGDILAIPLPGEDD